MSAYIPALRKAANGYTSDAMSADEVQSALIEGLFMAIVESKEGRLARLIIFKLAEALQADMATFSSWVSGNSRSLRTYFGLVRLFNGDLNAALENCEDHGMTRATFLACMDSLNSWTSLDEEENDDAEGLTVADKAHSSIWQSTETSAEDRALVEWLFTRVASDEATAIKWYYGFNSPKALLSDAAVADEWSRDVLGVDEVLAGQSLVSRATVQRLRNSGIRKMAEAALVDWEV